MSPGFTSVTGIASHPLPAASSLSAGSRVGHQPEPGDLLSLLLAAGLDALDVPAAARRPTSFTVSAFCTMTECSTLSGVVAVTSTRGRDSICTHVHFSQTDPQTR